MRVQLNRQYKEVFSFYTVCFLFKMNNLITPLFVR